jgi:hypothetical protein
LRVLVIRSLARTLEARAKAYREALHSKAVSVAREVVQRRVPVPLPGAKGRGYLMAHFDREPLALPLHDRFSVGSDKAAVGTLVAGACFDRRLDPVKLARNYR